MTNFKSIIIEVHQKHNSLMNQKYTWEKMNYLREGKFSSITFKPTIKESISTHLNKCNEKNSLKLTKCFDEFYMRKLNCSFPWLKKYNGNLQKCGNKQNLLDFKHLIKQTLTAGSSANLEAKNFGCMVPNCIETKWEEAKYEGFEATKYKSQIFFRFPASSEVSVFDFKKIEMCSDLLLITAYRSLRIRLRL